MRVVAIGGGHGLAATLRACATFAGSLTGVVSVADDGGSTGRLRASMPDLPAPGDLRRCLTALASPERAALAAALEHRFADGELAGHAAGNVLLAALVAEGGDLAAAADEVGRMLGARGRVLPATVEAVELVGHSAAGVHRGQVSIAAAPVQRVSLDPPSPRCPPDVLDAVAAADLVVCGPGSLYTSVLAALAVPDLAAAVAATRACVVLVANLRTDGPESAGYALADHLVALARHGVAPDAVVVDRGSHPAEDLPAGTPSVEVVRAPVATPGRQVHDPLALGAVLRGLARPVPSVPADGVA